MESLVQLGEITRVYRFGINAPSWERATSVSHHFIAYKLYGRTVHERDGKTWEFSPDMLMVANSEDVYKVTSHEFGGEGKRGSCIAVHFTTLSPFLLHLSTFQCAAYPQVKSSFFQMLDAWNLRERSPRFAADFTCAAHFYMVFAQLAHLLAEDQERLSSNFRAAFAKEYLDRNFANSSLTLADVAANGNVSQRRLNDLFASQYHETMGRYLTRIRLASAVALLRQRSFSVAEIASMVGYTSSSYFTRVFRQEMGTSPSVYRTKILGK